MNQRHHLRACMRGAAISVVLFAAATLIASFARADRSANATAVVTHVALTR